MLIFTNDLFGARLISVIFGMLTIPLAYYFGKEFLDNVYATFREKVKDPAFYERIEKDKVKL